MGKIYKMPFTWDFVDNEILLYENPTNEAEVKELINKALDDALDDFVDEAKSSMDIKLEGSDLLYKLIVNGSENGEINIPKDRFLKSTSYDSENKELIFVMETADGETTTRVSMTDLVASIEEKNAAQDTALEAKADKTELEPLAKAADVTSEIAAAVEPLATKEELSALETKVDAIVIPDVSGFAVKSEVDAALGLKADKTELEPLAVKSDVTSEIAAAVEPLATKEEVSQVDAKFDGYATKEELNQESARATNAENELQGKDAELQASIDQVDAKFADKADKTELEPLATKDELAQLDEKKVDWVESTAGRKHIVLANHDSILGTSTDGGTYNVAMVSKWDVADFGSAQLHLNLNSKDGVATINDNENIATEKFVGDTVSSAVDGLAKATDVTAEIAAAIAPLAVKSEVSEEIAGSVAPLATKEEVANKVDWTESTPGRKHIVLANHDSLLGTATDGSTYNVAMVSKWDVADFGSAQLHLNLNTSDEVTINDNFPIATQKWVGEQGFLTEHQDISGLATKDEMQEAAANAVAQVVANAPEDFDTLKEVADYIASDKTKASEIETKLSQHDAAFEAINAKDEAQDTALEAKADKSELEPLATKAEVQELETALNEEAQRATSVEGELQGKDVELQANIDALDAKVEAIVVPSVDGLASEDYVDEKVGEKADASELAALALVVNNKPNTSDIPTKTSELTNDSGFITNHQSLEDYASKAYVSGAIAEVVGTAPETLDTLGEIANALADNATMTMVSEAISTKANSDDVYTKGEIDNKIGNLGEVVEVEGQEATYWEDGDELPEGVEVGDVKTPAVDEVKREKSVKEYVDESVQTVNEKPEVMVLERKYGALLTLLNLRDTDINNTIVNQELAESNAVTYEDGSIDNIVVPETTKSKTITAELEPDTDLTLTSRYGVTINNTSEEATNLNVTAPSVENYNAATITLNGGEYDTITVTDASLTVQNGASVQNVVITQETTKNLTINAIFAEGATVTSSSNAAITLTSKNGEGEEVSVVLDAPGATVTMNNGNWVNVEAAVSANTLIINKNVHIENLNVTQGNVTVKVARQADIANVVENYTLASGYTIDYLHDDITSANVAKLTSEGTHTLTEDISKSGRFAPGMFASDDIIWNLNGHNITFTNTQGYANFLLRGSLHLEINGEGNVINNAGDYGFWAAAEGVKIVVNGGHFEAATHVLYAEKGTIEVNGGSFKLTNPDECDKDANGNFKFLLNCKDENYTAGTANIIVRGGKFYGFNPAVTYGEPSGPVSYVAEGYHVVESVEDGMKVYTVVAD